MAGNCLVDLDLPEQCFAYPQEGLDNTAWVRPPLELYEHGSIPGGLPVGRDRQLRRRRELGGIPRPGRHTLPRPMHQKHWLLRTISAWRTQLCILVLKNSIVPNFTLVQRARHPSKQSLVFHFLTSCITLLILYRKESPGQKSALGCSLADFLEGELQPFADSGNGQRGSRRRHLCRLGRVIGDVDKAPLHLRVKGINPIEQVI